MNAHAVAPTRHHGSAAWKVPALAGMAFGAYAGFLDRDNGASTNNAIVLGVVAGAVALVISLLIGRRQAGMPRELVSLAYGATFGSAMGFLVSLSGANTWLKATFLGLIFGLGMLFVTNYVLLYHRKD